MVEKDHAAGLSIERQCDLLSFSRSSYYYEAIGESLFNLELMRLIDEQFLETPYMAPGRWRGISGGRAIA